MPAAQLANQAAGGFWAADPSLSSVHLIDSPDGLELAREALSKCEVCGIDAEWKPGSSTPTATVLQLACRKLHRAEHTTVLLLDMLELCSHSETAALVSQLLQRLFAGDHIIKLGFGIAADLRAIYAALGNKGSACIAQVHSYVDVKQLHARLRLAGVPVGTALAGGLSDLVATVLGKRLDKAQQCSAWHVRPLTPAQLTYAAADAAVLLAIFDGLLQAVPAQLWRQHDGALGSIRSSSTPQEGSTSLHSATAHARSHAATSAGASSFAATPPRMQRASAQISTRGIAAMSEAHPSVLASHALPDDPYKLDTSSADDDSNDDNNTDQEDASWWPLSRRWLQKQDSTHASCLHTFADTCWSVAAIKQCFCSTIGLVDGRAIDTGQHEARHRSVDGSVDGSGSGTRPLFIPWVHGTADDKRFVCDVMLEGLARQLRLYGLDAKCMLVRHKTQRQQLIRDMLELGVREQRLVLTSDRSVVAMRDSAHVLFVRADEKRRQLAEVVQALAIELDPQDIMSRCTACGGALIDRPFAFDELPPASIETFSKQGTLDGLCEAVSQFWVCARCSKAFWQGGQYANAVRQLTARCKKMGKASMSQQQHQGASI